MSLQKKVQTTVLGSGQTVIVSSAEPRDSPDGTTIANPPLAPLKKLSSRKPLRRSPPRDQKRKE